MATPVKGRTQQRNWVSFSAFVIHCVLKIGSKYYVSCKARHLWLLYFKATSCVETVSVVVDFANYLSTIRVPLGY